MSAAETSNAVKDAMPKSVMVRHYEGDYPIVVSGLSNSFDDQVVHENLRSRCAEGKSSVSLADRARANRY